MSQLGLQPVLWSISVDHMVGGEGLTVREAVSALMLRVRPGDIVLLHDAPVGRDGSADLRQKALRVLTEALPRLRDAGFRFAGLSRVSLI